MPILLVAVQQGYPFSFFISNRDNVYCLYQSLASQKELFSLLQPFYISVMDTYSEPGISLSCCLASIRVTFKIETQGDHYLIRFEKKSNDEIPNLEVILEDIGFLDNGDSFQILSERSDIETLLMKLDKALDSAFNNKADHA